MEKNKVLIIRFSSFGDIVQCSSVVESIAQNKKNTEIDWITRKEFTELVKLNKNITNVYGFDRQVGFLGLIKTAFELRNKDYDLVYDAHNNIRSNIIKFIFTLTLFNGIWATRSKDRWKRIKLFKFRINDFPKPFKGIDSFLAPLLKLGYKELNTNSLVNYSFNSEVESKIKNLIHPNKKVVTLVPSAAWAMKRWPLDYWKQLVTLNSDVHFYILGGKEDTFCEEIKNMAPERCDNLAGKLSLIESSCFIKFSNVVISADTGLLHVADVLGIKAISLMGPTAFGFTKSSLIKTLEIDLPCRPCSKDGSGKCSQATYQKCMVDISPKTVNSELNNILSHFPE